MRSIQSLTRILCLVFATSAVLFSLGHGIQAAPFVEVTYDLGDTTGTSTATLPLIGPVESSLPADRFSGTQTIRYRSDSASGVINGPVSLVSFDLTVDARLYSSSLSTALYIATSTLHLQLEGAPLPGGTLAGATVSFPGGTALVHVTGAFHCRALCAAINASISVSTPIQTTTAMQPLPMFFTSSGASKVTGTSSVHFSIDPAAPSTSTLQIIPIVLQTNLVGREISRRPVPEPGTLALLGVGLGGIALTAGTGGWIAKRTRG